MAKRSSGKMGDRWYAWWRGDQIEADFAKQVSRALRAMAYQTMVGAKERVIRRPYMEWFEKTTKKGKYRGRWREQKRFRFGPSGKRWRQYIPSKPGESPTNQTGFLRASIKYAFRDNGNGLLESFAGPTFGNGMKRSGGGLIRSDSDLPTKALEYGGYTINHGGRRVYIAARPFVRPAGLEVLKSGLLRRTLENSLGRNSQAVPNPAIGWLGT